MKGERGKTKDAESFSVRADGTRVLTCEASDADAGQHLIDWLCARFPSYLRATWESAITSGALTVEGESTTPDVVVVRGMRVVYHAEPEREPPIDDTYSICFEDAYFAVVNKSGNLPSHPAGRYFEHSLTRLLVARGGFEAAFAVNRLDRETSGLILIAKTQEAASRAGRQLMGGRIDKLYLVWVEGEWTRSAPGEPFGVRGTIRLVRGPVIRKKQIFIAGDHDPRGQVAETIFTCIRTRGGQSLLTARPVTGRPHQIRATLKALGCPVVGDKLYGVDEMIYVRLYEGTMTERDQAVLRLPHQALHAWRLAFRHPFSGKELAFETDLPIWAAHAACEDAPEGVY